MKKAIISICIITQLIACKKSYFEPTIKKPSSFSELYTTLWKGINDNYVYWDVDTTNWNNIYHLFKQEFTTLDINKKEDVLKSYALIRQMTNTLIDGHFQIVFEHEVLKGLTIYPLANRNRSNPVFHSPFDYSKGAQDYFDPAYAVTYDSTTDPAQAPLKICVSTIRNKILYIAFNRFSLFRSYHSPTNDNTRKTLDIFFNYVNNVPPGIKGVILDVRNNFGGDVTDLDFFVASLINSKLHFGYTRYKLSEAAQHFTPWIESYITGKNTTSAFINRPFVILVDLYSASMAETTALIIKQLPQGKIIGEKTWGATGPIGNSQLYHTGQFNIEGFCHVYMSSAAFKDINGNIYESIGIQPDIQIPFNIVNLEKGIDEQLEKAIEIIR